ncbi:MAG: class I SAM-dependent methyltransferase [Hyphomicrobiaceae bacterium]
MIGSADVLRSDRDDRLLAAARALVREVAGVLDLDVSVRLWDGSLVPLGRAVASPLTLTIADPGVIAGLVRRPTLDRLIRSYAHGRIGIEGGTLIDLGLTTGSEEARARFKRFSLRRLIRHLLPFLTVAADAGTRTREFAAGKGGDSAYIQFHYDVGNDFYRLFLDPQMVYSCAYFTEWPQSLEQAQSDKLDMICRKLRLQPGERFLDIGCGWGALICHAAVRYDVTAHGITLSKEQAAFARSKIAAMGLDGRVTVALQDYRDVTGTYDKIASIGMYEHIGRANISGYMTTVRRALSDRGLFLNHAISRRAKQRQRRFGARPEQRALLKYIFPGGELDDIGHTVAAMEQAGFEVYDVEGWRWHYALTTRHWCERLYANRDKAEALVGAPVVRLWLAYLAGCSLAFQRGSARIFQTLAGKSAKGLPPVPPTRADLYR